MKKQYQITIIRDPETNDIIMVFGGFSNYNCRNSLDPPCGGCDKCMIDQAIYYGNEAEIYSKGVFGTVIDNRIHVLKKPFHDLYK